MSTRIHVVLVLLAVVISAPSQAFAQGEPTASEPAAARASSGARVASPISSFGLNVFRHVAADVTEPNVVFSPISVGLAVALLTEGSEHETRAELLAALGTTEEGWLAYQYDIRALLSNLTADTTAVTRIASSLWANERAPLRRGYVERAEELHLATVRSLDLQAPSTPAIVDGWAYEMTNGLIPKVMPAVHPDLDLVLLNAVYFKGLWEHPFDRGRTKPAPFVRAGHDTIQVPTMVRGGRFGGFEHDGARGLRIPYRGDRYAAYIVVPESVPVQEVVRTLTVADVDGWSARARPRNVDLHLPSFEHRGRSSLLDALAHAGVPLLVSAGAHLHNLWQVPPDLLTTLNEAAQVTYIRVDEEGTEAAAVTGFAVVVTGSGPPPPVFRADAPFVFVIRDEVTGALLFVAQIGDPSDDGG